MSFHGLTPAACERLESVLLRFEDAWRAGDRPDLADFLPADGPERRALLVELVQEDLYYRLAAGEAGRVEDYLERYPELAHDAPALLDLLVAEYQLRRRREPDLLTAEYARRFPGLGDVLPRRFPAEARSGSALADTGKADSVVSGGGGAASGTAGGGPPAIAGYEILGELGRGGMGVVYQARHRKLNRVVALKMVLAGSHAAPDDRIRFLAEAEAVAALQHPHIVPLYEFGQQEGLPFFTLEHVPGGSLAAKLGGTPLPPKEAARLVEQVARGVHYAHGTGIVHRDLKPANILLAADGTPKVTDFGLAKRVEVGAGLTASGAVLGTPSYMAPEQARGEGRHVGPAADVYALGAILYECLTGRPPFKAATMAETLLQVLSEEPVPPGRLLPGLPRDLETICLKCLQKERRKRYASADALAEDLRRFQAGEPIRARPVGRLERGWKWARRNPAMAGLAAAVVVALVVVAAALAVVNAERARTAVAYANLTAEQEKTQVAYQAEARRRRQAREALDAMSSEVIDDWLARQEKLSPSQKDFLEKALASYEEFAQDTGQDEEARTGVAAAHLHAGGIRRSLGQPREAEAAFRRAQELYARLAADFPGRGEILEGLGQCHLGVGLVLRRRRGLKGAEEAFRQAVAVFEQAAARNPARPALHQDLATAHDSLASLFSITGRSREAQAEYRAALAVDKQLVADFPDRPEFCEELLKTQYNLSQSFGATKQWKEAETAVRAGLALAEPLVSRFPTRARYRERLAMVYVQLGQVHHHLTRLGEAEEAYQKALPLLKGLANDFPSVPAHQNDVALALGGLADVIAGKDPERARRLLEEAAPYSLAAIQADPGNIDYLAHFYDNRWKVVHVLVQLRDHAGAADAAEAVEQGLHTPEDIFELARQYCLCVSLAQKDPKLADSERKALVRKYGDRAVDALRRAVQYGYKDLDNLKKAADLDALRGRADFQKLLADLGAAQRRAQTPAQRGP
jgi:tetratricopeptide (TPR) repeat protein/tRNA A-37 threonylcarbamoyl transferase component Bud32